MTLIRVNPLNKETREDIEIYLKELPIKMPKRIKQMRYILKKLDLDQFEDQLWKDWRLLRADLELLKTLKALDVPIGRGKNEDWVDLRGVFVSRHSAAEDAKVIFNVRRNQDSGR